MVQQLELLRSKVLELLRSKVLELVRSKVLELVRSKVLELVRSKLVLEHSKLPYEQHNVHATWRTIRRHSSFQQLEHSTQLVLEPVHSSCEQPLAWQTDRHRNDQLVPTNRC
jgi:hypothetical protein